MQVSSLKTKVTYTPEEAKADLSLIHTHMVWGFITKLVQM